MGKPPTVFAELLDIWKGVFVLLHRGRWLHKNVNFFPFSLSCQSWYNLWRYSIINVLDFLIFLSIQKIKKIKQKFLWTITDAPSRVFTRSKKLVLIRINLKENYVRIWVHYYQPLLTPWKFSSYNKIRLGFTVFILNSVRSKRLSFLFWSLWRTNKSELNYRLFIIQIPPLLC